MSRELSAKLDDALVYASSKLDQGRSVKPVIIHSVRVALGLWNLGYEDSDLLTAALLHDVIEDSSTATMDQLNVVFGSKVATLVNAVTYKKEISDPIDRIEELFERVLSAGKDACLIKCMDTLDNSYYIQYCHDISQQEYLINKIELFLSKSKPVIGSSEIWAILKTRWTFEQQRYALLRNRAA